jgi:hypothetical protein
VKPVSSHPPARLPEISASIQRPPIVLFDASHGQPNWAQTGFTSRELHTNFAGINEHLSHLGFLCLSTKGAPLGHELSRTCLLVLPPPTGRYNSRKERWEAAPAFFFTGPEICAVLSFLRAGGHLLAFAYRFGDSFTQTNLSDLFGPLGCHLNDDAIIDAVVLRQTHPLQMHFETPHESLPLAWSRVGVTTVLWRPSATFTILPGATAWPLAFSTGGRCLSFNRTFRQISFESLPLAVAGRCGKGRFALFGGPHAFETGPLGLLANKGNARFLENTLHWLLSDGPEETASCPHGEESIDACERLTRVECRGEGERTIASVERLLRRTGVLKALGRAKWMP